jgi:hypothetical protein
MKIYDSDLIVLGSKRMIILLSLLTLLKWKISPIASFLSLISVLYKGAPKDFGN